MHQFVMCDFLVFWKGNHSLRCTASDPVIKQVDQVGPAGLAPVADESPRTPLVRFVSQLVLVCSYITYSDTQHSVSVFHCQTALYRKTFSRSSWAKSRCAIRVHHFSQSVCSVRGRISVYSLYSLPTALHIPLSIPLHSPLSIPLCPCTDYSTDYSTLSLYIVGFILDRPLGRVRMYCQVPPLLTIIMFGSSPYQRVLSVLAVLNSLPPTTVYSLQFANNGRAMPKFKRSAGGFDPMTFCLWSR